MDQILCPFSDDVINRVLYRCTCGVSNPLSRMYFCRHCSEIRCRYCVSHEVDSHYCPNCLENMPSAEARLKKNRCANCFDCPSCGHTLSTKATGVSTGDSSSSGNSNSPPKKVYYLACVFCRWTSRDIGLPNQTVASGGWNFMATERGEGSEDFKRIAALLEQYRSIAQREKLERESKKHVGRKLSYMQLTDKYGLARKRAGLPPLAIGRLSTESDTDKSNVLVPPAEAVEIDNDDDVIDLNQLPSDVYSVTKMNCRLNQVDTQPVDVKDIYPRHMQLMIKGSQRCRKCEHNLSKPEYNPTSIKFKIQLAAFYHVPEIIVYRSGGPWTPGKSSKFMLKIVNPTQHATDVEFLNEDEVRDFNEMDRERRRNTESQKTIGSLLRQPSLIVASDRHNVIPTASCELPVKGTKIFLPPRDDTAEFDEAGPDLKGAIDDKSVVAWRKSNKVGIVLGAVPFQVQNDDDDEKPDVITTFGLKFLYTNTVSALEQKDVQTVEIVIPVYLNLGKLN